MDLRLLEPSFLALAVLALVPWLGALSGRLRAPDRRHALIRSLVFVLVALALARPAVIDREGPAQRVLIVDRSASLTDRADAAALEWLAAALESSDEDDCTVIEIAGPERPPLELPRDVRALAIEPSRAPTSAGRTPLGAALAAAVRVIPRGTPASVVLLTDGLATGADWARASGSLALRGIPVDVRFLPEPEGDLRPVALDVLGTARVGATCHLEARLVGGGQVVNCRLQGPRGELASAMAVTVDGPTRVSLAFEPDAAGFLEVALELEVTDGLDPRVGDTRLVATLAVQDPLRVLYMGERMRGGAERLEALLGPGFEVQDSGPEVDVGALESTDLVVLDDRPAARVPEELQRALIEGVLDRGLGLVAAGGEAAFGPGGYHDQPLETLLPVELVQKEEKRDPSTALVVIIDTSGSMGGNRVQLAKEVSRLAIRRLLPHDKVGIVEFYGAKRWAAPLQPASNSIEIERALNRLNAGGGTVILPAIEEAYYGLKNVRTRYKHVLILTDGGVETGAFEPLLRRMADDGINSSTVLIGPDAHSEFLVSIANWGQGRFYSVPNRFNLPEILLKQPASAKLPAYRPGLTNVRGRGGRGWWGDVDPKTVPPVAGYVETRARPGAERVVETVDEAHPVLASWRYGLGRVSALTTEPTGPGTEPWNEWSGYGALLARVLARTAADTSAPFQFRLERDALQVVLVAERRGAASFLPAASFVGEDGREPITFERVATDRFEARFLPAIGQATRIEAGANAPGAQTSGSRSSGAQSSEAIAGPVTRLVLDDGAQPDRERLVDPLVRDSLRALAAATGGQARALTDAGAGRPAHDDATGALRLRPLWPLAALLALLAYLLDVFYRRRSPSTRAAGPIASSTP